MVGDIVRYINGSQIIHGLLLAIIRPLNFIVSEKGKLLKYCNEDNIVSMTFWKDFSGGCHGE